VKKCKLQSDYSKSGGYIQLCLPIETEVFIPVDNSVRLLDRVLEELDYSKLYRSYSSTGRNPSVSPKRLFKVMVYAYSQGLYSTRKIEEACRLNLAFQYLLRGDPAPDHNTLARFRIDRLEGCIEDLLTQLVEWLSAHGEISFEHLFVDGTKVEANANRYSFVWKKAILKHELRLQAKASKKLTELFPAWSLGDYITSEHLSQALTLLDEEIQAKHIVFVSGKGNHKTPLQRDYEELQGYLTRQRKYDQYNALFSGRNSFSKTDHDATFMRLKDDHMRNSQLKPAYNLQVAVESEYIVGIDISSERSDVGTLKPFLKRLRANYGRTFQNLICDAGYESEENYTYLEQEQITPYIKPSNYEYSKTRKFQRDMAFRLRMEYLPDQDAYRCKDGRLLSYRYDIKRKSPSGFESKSKVYQCQSCDGCPHLGHCYKGKYSKRIQVAEVFDNYRRQSLHNITTEKGRLLRVNRSIQAEGVFGVLKWNYGFKRFLTRGHVNVRTESLLLALGFNINKLHHRIRNERFRQPLFLLKKPA
jgi:transposase